MNTIIAMYLMTHGPAVPPKTPYKVDHCYSSDSEFAPRFIKILEVGHSEYRYSLWSKNEWYGNMSNTIDTVNDVYPKEVDCEKI